MLMVHVPYGLAEQQFCVGVFTPISRLKKEPFSGILSMTITQVKEGQRVSYQQLVNRTESDMLHFYVQLTGQN